jgi:hypothetical protein
MHKTFIVDMFTRDNLYIQVETVTSSSHHLRRVMTPRCVHQRPLHQLLQHRVQARHLSIHVLQHRLVILSPVGYIIASW